MAFDKKRWMMKVSGRDYLPVKARLLWFREDHADWAITTTAVVLDVERGVAVFHASVSDETGRVLSEGTKLETAKGFGDFVEKAESGAVGRALGMLGYGTEFEPAFDDGAEPAAYDDHMDNGVSTPKPAPHSGQVKSPKIGSLLRTECMHLLEQLGTDPNKAVFALTKGRTSDIDDLTHTEGEALRDASKNRLAERGGVIA